jgi:glutamate-ammonia-ligase adenylyltransferase
VPQGAREVEAGIDHTGGVLTPELEEAAERSAAPVASRHALERLARQQPDSIERLDADPGLAAAVVTVTGASRHLTHLVENDPEALDVLANLDERRPPKVDAPDQLPGWKDREYLRIAARDLLDVDSLEVTVALVSALARDVVAVAHDLVDVDGSLATIGMGKLGAGELNYASDIDVMFAGSGDPTALDRSARRLTELARSCFRVDANLRPEGRDGQFVRAVSSYETYWDRWAQPWEFQALLKARTVAGDAEVGAAFEAAAARHLWSRVFSPDDLRSLRHLKARAEAEVARKGLTDREVKRGRGGIRDVEFAVQLLQLVHGRLDADLRSPATLDALAELASAGYVDPDDAAQLAEAYRFLRRLEHRLQLYDGTQVYAMPADEAERTRIARTLGFRDTSSGTAVSQLDAALARHQATVRSIHERLYFRPLLEAFAAGDDELLGRPGAIEARLAAFGFSDGLRTRAAVRELTRGLTRTSRLMQQMLPLLLGWLSESPDPDLGLLNVRNLASDRRRAEELTRSFRESPESARSLCLLVGTTRLAAETLQRDVELVDRLPHPELLRTLPKVELVERARRAIEWRDELPDRQRALKRWKDRHLLGVIARDVLHGAPAAKVDADITAVAEASLEVALASVAPKVPFAVIALGRFAGGELSYASDLDVVLAYDGTTPADFEEATRTAMGLRRFVDGATPAERIWDLDLDLRPEGKQGPVARSLDGYAKYFHRWALAWERQAMARARPVAGDPDVAARFMALLDDFVWEPGLSADDLRDIRRMKARIERERIPIGDDPAFHLKLGRGSLSDIEWTAQLLQLRWGVRSPSTMGALELLTEQGLLDAGDADVLAGAYRYCEATRNRLFLVRSRPGSSLPREATELLWLARSLGTTPSELREQYRRVTRRARKVMERLFYAKAT